jgi:hypothetical protein
MFLNLSNLLVVLQCVIQYFSMGVLSYPLHLTKTFVTLIHYLFRKVERAGNLRPILICKILAFEY